MFFIFVKTRFTNNKNFSWSIFVCFITEEKALTLLETILIEQRRIRKKLDTLEGSMEAVASSNSNQRELVEPVAETSLDLPAKSIQEMQSIEKAFENTDVFQNLVSVYVDDSEYVFILIVGKASVLSIPA